MQRAHERRRGAVPEMIQREGARRAFHANNERRAAASKALDGAGDVLLRFDDVVHILEVDDERGGGISGQVKRRAFGKAGGRRGSAPPRNGSGPARVSRVERDGTRNIDAGEWGANSVTRAARAGKTRTSWRSAHNEDSAAAASGDLA